jgi:hypothetical protein
MAFCGQCGYQLQTTGGVCPRCGMVTEPMPPTNDPYATLEVDGSNPDSPTVAMPQRMPGQTPTFPHTPPHPQQPVAFRPVDNNTATEPVSHPGTNTSFPDYPPQSQGSSYPGYPPRTNPGTLSPGVYYPPTVAAPQRRRRGPIGFLAIVVLLLLIAGGALTWFLLHGKASPVTGNGQTPVPTVISSPTLTPAQHAQAVINQYYNDINNRDYQDAYNLLGPAMQQNQSYSNFVSGYAHTHHDTITISNITAQSNGTYMVTLTIQATEDATSGTGTQTSIYQGSDIVGQVNGTWKILSGNFQKTSTVPG